jgi:hypothetical protein
MENLITFLGIMNVLLMINQLLHQFWYRKNTSILRETNQVLIERINEAYADHRELYIYTLHCVIKDCIEREDYETANQCKKLIDKYQEI